MVLNSLHAVVTPNHKITFSVSSELYFVTVMNHSKYLWFPMVLDEPCEKVIGPKGVMTHK